MTYTARSASDKTDDWPFWMIWDGHKNVTGKIIREFYFPFPYGEVFVPRAYAEHYAALANEKGVKL